MNVIVKGSYTHDEMLAYTNMSHDKGAPQLPTPPFLMLHGILEINGDAGEYSRGFARAKCVLEGLEPVFECHFPGRPVLPASMMLEGVLQLAGFWLVWNGTVQGEGIAMSFGGGRVKRVITPDDEEVEILIDVKRVVRREGMHSIYADGRIKMGDGSTAFTVESVSAGIVLPE